MRFEARTEILFELFIIFWRCLGISKENQINEEIRDKEVRVISADGEQVGVMSAKEAIALAERANLLKKWIDNNCTINQEDIKAFNERWHRNNAESC